MRFIKLDIPFFVSITIALSGVPQSKQTDIALLHDMVETRLDIDWMMHRFKIANIDFEKIPSSDEGYGEIYIKEYQNMVMPYVNYYAIISPDFHRDRYPELGDIDSLEERDSPLSLSRALNMNFDSIREMWNVRKAALERLSDKIKISLREVEVKGVQVIQNDWALRTDGQEIKGMIGKLEALDEQRHNLLSTINRFQDLQTNSVENIFSTLRKQYKHNTTYLKELEILEYRTIRSAQKNEPKEDLPEAVHIKKLKAPQNRHTGRMLWQAKAFCTKLEGIIKTFAEEVEYAIQNESKAKNVQNNLQSDIGQTLKSIFKSKEAVNTSVDRLYRLFGARFWKYLLEFKSNPRHPYILHEVEKIIDLLYEPKIPSDEFKIPEKEAYDILNKNKECIPPIGGELKKTLESSRAIRRTLNAIWHIFKLPDANNRQTQAQARAHYKKPSNDEIRKVHKLLKDLIRIRTDVYYKIILKTKNPNRNDIGPLKYKDWETEYGSDPDYPIEVYNLDKIDRDLMVTSDIQPTFLEHLLIEEIKSEKTSAERFQNIHKWVFKRLDVMKDIQNQLGPQPTQTEESSGLKYVSGIARKLKKHFGWQVKDFHSGSPS